MSLDDDAIDALRSALEVSPDNLPLRRHLAESMLKAGRLEEAEDVYRQTLARAPHDALTKMGLIRTFIKRVKLQEAMVLLDDVLKDPEAPGEMFVHRARVLLSDGEVRAAVDAYKTGVARDPAAADESLADLLGIQDEEEGGADETAEEVVDGRVRAFADDGPGGGTTAEVERPKIAFDDVGGMAAVKEDIRIKIIHPLEHPEIYRAYGKTIGGGVLLYGPPGCGKTHLARATAGEVQARFISVGINDVLDMWLGNSERNLHETFSLARRSSPSVLFFDEVDALGSRRSDMRQSAGRMLINQFLSELDGLEGNNDGLLVLGATNAPWHLDPAFRRPGRFDQVIFVPPPDQPARMEILEIMLREKPVKDIDTAKVARKTDGFSGADLKGVVDRAVEGKLKAAIKSGVPEPLTTRDLLSAVRAHRPTAKEWFATARNHALYSNEGGIYDDVLAYLNLK